MRHQLFCLESRFVGLAAVMTSMAKNDSFVASVVFFFSWQLRQLDFVSMCSLYALRL